MAERVGPRRALERGLQRAVVHAAVVDGVAAPVHVAGEARHDAAVVAVDHGHDLVVVPHEPRGRRGGGVQGQVAAQDDALAVARGAAEHGVEPAQLGLPTPPLNMTKRRSVPSRPLGLFLSWLGLRRSRKRLAAAETGWPRGQPTALKS